MFFSKATNPDHDIRDHHYYDNYTLYSYYCSNYCSIVAIVTTVYIHCYIQQIKVVTIATYIAIAIEVRYIINIIFVLVTLNNSITLRIH